MRFGQQANKGYSKRKQRFIKVFGIKEFQTLVLHTVLHNINGFLMYFYLKSEAKP